MWVVMMVARGHTIVHILFTFALISGLTVLLSVLPSTRTVLLLHNASQRVLTVAAMRMLQDFFSDVYWQRHSNLRRSKASYNKSLATLIQRPSFR